MAAQLQQFPGSGRNGDPQNDGEGAKCKVGAMDMSREKDRLLLTSRRWPISAEQRERYVKALDLALEIATRKGDQRAIQNIVRTLGFLEGQNLSDEHLAATLAARAVGGEDIKLRVVYEQSPPLLEDE